MALIPTPKVVRVEEPRCIHCKGTFEVIVDDGILVCRPCVHMKVRLAGVSLPRSDHENREGQWP